MSNIVNRVYVILDKLNVNVYHQSCFAVSRKVILDKQHERVTFDYKIL